MGYELTGRFFEACDCAVPCPCWFEQNPEDDECTGLIAWQIERGTINGFDVAGRTVVSLSHHGGHRNSPEHVHLALVLDDETADGQVGPLSEAFSGQLGGPLGELAALFPSPTLLERAPISFTRDGRSTRLQVGPRVLIESRLLVGAAERPITIGDGVMSNLLGPIGESGKASRFELELPGREPISGFARSTTSGQFRYRHEA
ncbi:DUF1326 domain-containing protein [Conexibacter sp. JD483]|uniref:DUF1326 domain-containing protein n=1 Tax=unclassified Conexibacter TaxID=2627773 RepID=UPI002727FAAE|nr:MULTISPECIES: DUF1326 domain-containing protein [unclassified Conexibacter]MDO8185477.1 DUF1326 domain-containing protein [Conexibacter sp. CPCC 205706]MDO8197336.1 DUF1326 domain-containing protein [Conexibacter sp. CPCC 205762]MDR9371100.1 DUF1326 domain-containing protein [Conexibacter sp. JD483]